MGLARGAGRRAVAGRRARLSSGRGEREDKQRARSRGDRPAGGVEHLALGERRGLASRVVAALHSCDLRLCSPRRRSSGGRTSWSVTPHPAPPEPAAWSPSGNSSSDPDRNEGRSSRLIPRRFPGGGEQPRLRRPGASPKRPERGYVDFLGSPRLGWHPRSLDSHGAAGRDVISSARSKTRLAPAGGDYRGTSSSPRHISRRCCGRLTPRTAPERPTSGWPGVSALSGPVIASWSPVRRALTATRRRSALPDSRHRSPRPCPTSHGEW